MPCTSPLAGYQDIDTREIRFKETPNSRFLNIPCGQCRSCRQKRVAEIATRCTHELQIHRYNCFVTLTYSDEHLPELGSLHKPHLQGFFKRLRHHMGPFRHYACGEYGTETHRAHYHACLFGIDFSDKVPFKRSGEHTLYLSNTLQQIWGHGNTSVGSLTYETAAYTAAYIFQRTLGKGCPKYNHLDTETGELIALQQPFCTSSNGGGKALIKGGIGAQWLRTYHQDIYGHNKDFFYTAGKKLRPPRYYDKIYDSIDNEHMEEIKAIRRRNSTGLTSQELHTRDKIAHARTTVKRQL